MASLCHTIWMAFSCMNAYPMHCEKWLLAHSSTCILRARRSQSYRSDRIDLSAVHNSRLDQNGIRKVARQLIRMVGCYWNTSPTYASIACRTANTTRKGCVCMHELEQLHVKSSILIDIARARTHTNDDAWQPPMLSRFIELITENDCHHLQQLKHISAPSPLLISHTAILDIHGLHGTHEHAKCTNCPDERLDGNIAVRIITNDRAQHGSRFVIVISLHTHTHTH